jgi:hypothetical protein
MDNNCGLRGVKETPASGRGRRNRLPHLPHHCKERLEWLFPDRIQPSYSTNSHFSPKNPAVTILPG